MYLSFLELILFLCLNTGTFTTCLYVTFYVLQQQCATETRFSRVVVTFVDHNPKFIFIENTSVFGHRNLENLRCIKVSSTSAVSLHHFHSVSQPHRRRLGDTERANAHAGKSAYLFTFLATHVARKLFLLYFVG